MTPERLDQLERRVTFLFDTDADAKDMHDIFAAARREAALREAIDRALHELGVPDENYPAPVAHAVDILNAALLSEVPQ